MDISKIKPGQILYSVERTGVGNTMLRTTSVFRVEITDVDPDHKAFWAKWNGNPKRRYFRVPNTWRAKKPTLVDNRLTSRLAHRGEAGDLVEKSCYFELRIK